MVLSLAMDNENSPLNVEQDTAATAVKSTDVAPVYPWMAAPQPPIIVWHSPVYYIPEPVMRIFNTPKLYNSLCDYCRCMENVAYKNGWLTEFLCSSCRIKISRNDEECSGYSSKCKKFRFVDPLGNIAPVCSECDKVLRITMR